MAEGVKRDLSGILTEFKVHVDRWSTYMSRLKAWFMIQDVKPAEQSKYLVACVGTEALDLIIDLCYPDKPETVSITVIEKLVEEHLSPKRSVIAERMIFRSCKQTDGQSISEYLVQLRKLSKACKFSSPNVLKEHIRDQFVHGLLSDRIRQRIMTENDADLTLTRATELALSLEAAVRDSATAGEAERARAEPELVHAVGGARASHSKQRARARGRRRQDVSGSGASRGQRCYRCHGQHQADSCSFINSECYVCGKKGHIAKVCRLRKMRQIHGVGDACSTDSSTDSGESGPVCVYQLSDEDADDRWNIAVKINGKPLVFEGDTGSAVSIISYKTFRNYFLNCSMRPYYSNLKMYSGQKIKPKGELICDVDINGILKSNLSLIVIDNEFSPSLLGRNWMRSFDIPFPRVNEVHNMIAQRTPTNHKDALKVLMDKFPTVFESGIGTFNKCTIKLELAEGAAPVWRRARPVPHALRPAVERELARLQREGVLAPVEWSEWGTPVVPVLKKNGQVRLCGDFKTTVNPVLVDDKYPIPRKDRVQGELARH